MDAQLEEAWKKVEVALDDAERASQVAAALRDAVRKEIEYQTGMSKREMHRG